MLCAAHPPAHQRDRVGAVCWRGISGWGPVAASAPWFSLILPARSRKKALFLSLRRASNTISAARVCKLKKIWKEASGLRANEWASLSGRASKQPHSPALRAALASP
jgi:hypothetical protein